MRAVSRTSGAKQAKRLLKIAEMVPRTERYMADIGTDHGKLAIQLCAREHSEVVWATDISRNGEAESRFCSLPAMLSTKLRLRYGDGLEPLLADPEAVEKGIGTVIMSGMGIWSILDIMCSLPSDGVEEGYEGLTFSNPRSNATTRRSSWSP